MMGQVLDAMLKEEDKIKSKYFAVMFFYSTYYLGLVDSPYEDSFILKGIKYFDTMKEALNVYANVRCPASQLIEAKTKEELDFKIEEMKNNFNNPKWLEENIYPYI